MEIFETREGSLPIIRLSGVKCFDVEKTFDCGQCFRFERVENSAHKCEFAGVAYGRHVSFAEDGDELYIYGSDRADFENIWGRFLSLDMDYEAIDKDILEHSAGTVMDRAMEYGRGIRILRQEPYETVISFIISQNNNIPRIKKIIEAMSEKSGTRIELGEEALAHTSGKSSLCAFPDHNALLALGEQGLADLKTGFRAKYIYDAVARIKSGELDLGALEGLERTEECLSTLCTVKGIGLKVASCTALFGLGRYDAFPIDVWMKRVAEKYFPEDREFSGERFGRYAGIAQQYLFYYERNVGSIEKNAEKN
jgi:N-glycosylase/DNA lyase